MPDYSRFLKSHNSMRDARRTSKVKNRGGGGAFKDRWAPPKVDDGEEPEEIVLFKGNYQMDVKVGKKLKDEVLERDYYLYFEHGTGSKKKYRSHVCSAGLKLVAAGENMELTFGDDPCVSCFHIDDSAAGISRRIKHVFNLSQLGYWHLVDSDETDDNGKPYKDWEECDGKRCKHCNDGIEKVFGRRRFWELGTLFMDQLLTHAETTLAKHCKCGGDLEVVGLECECGEVLADFQEDPVSKKELFKEIRKDRKCPNCGTIEPGIPVHECSGCNKPEPLEIWDVVYTIARSGKDTSSALMISDWRILDDKLRKKLKKTMKPYNFAKSLLKPPDLETQSERMGVPNPFESSKKSGKAKWKDD